MSSTASCHTVRMPLIGLAAMLMTGCASLDGFCVFSCGSTAHASSTPLVSFLYPDGEIPPPAVAPVLPVPMRVGLTFVPGEYGDIPTADRYAVLERVRARFAKLPYVREITIVPEGYLSPRSGFTGLEQVSRLQGFDVMALVSLDQVAARAENSAALAYLTIVGAFLVEGSEHQTHMLLDLAVVEPQSRTLLLRAAGTSSLKGDSTAVDQAKAIGVQSGEGIEVAAESLLANLSVELDSFAARVKAGTAPIKVAKRGDGGGGPIDSLTAALLLGLLFMQRGARASRETARRASART